MRDSNVCIIITLSGLMIVPCLQFKYGLTCPQLRFKKTIELSSIII
jgi:hypothetical protein